MSLTKAQEDKLEEIKQKTAYEEFFVGPELREHIQFLLSIIDSLRADLQASLDTPCVVESAFKKMETEVATLKKENDLLQASLKSSDDIRHAEKEILIKEIEMTATLKKENEHLKKFLEWLFMEVFEGSPDGGDIQDKAEEMGILKLCKVDPKDQQFEEKCAEYDTDELYFWYWHEQALKSEGRE